MLPAQSTDLPHGSVYFGGIVSESSFVSASAIRNEASSRDSHQGRRHQRLSSSLQVFNGTSAELSVL